MLIRALIVLLIVLNVGVAAWWISRPEPPPPALPAQPAGVPRLQLLSESGRSAVPAQAPAPVTPVAPSPPPVAATEPAAPVVEPAAPAQCFSIGPFADQAAASSAAARIGSRIARGNPRQVPGRTAQGYNVVLPPQTDREAARALAQRIGAAGFDDYLVVNSGAQANGIALGRYRSREGAERRQAALRAAGFDAQLQSIGDEGAAQWWLDVAAAAGVTASGLRSAAGASQSRSLDCALLR